jgi:hypothetical protein
MKKASEYLEGKKNLIIVESTSLGGCFWILSSGELLPLTKTPRVQSLIST